MNDKRFDSIGLYRQIYLIRMVEEKVREIYPTDNMKTPVHLSLGEESIVAGICQALNPGDQVYGTYRSHALYLARGGNLDAFFGEMYGRASGCAGGKAGSMHLSAPEVGFMASSAVVGTIIPVALGAAFAKKFKKTNDIVAVFFGDGATEEGVFWESINVSALKQLPVLFVCEDNELAIHAPIKDRQVYSLADAVGSFQIPLTADKTTDPQKIYQAAHKAVDSIRSTGRPHFLHLKYHRHLEHVGINEDYSHGYRCRETYQEWYDADPVLFQRKHLLAIGFPETEIKKIESRIDQRIEDSARQAAAASFPDSCELFEDVYR